VVLPRRDFVINSRNAVKAVSRQAGLEKFIGLHNENQLFNIPVHEKRPAPPEEAVVREGDFRT